jgi:hypothetical protein
LNVGAATPQVLEQRVSFAVDNATAEELLDALLAPAGLTYVREAQEVRVLPR